MLQISNSVSDHKVPNKHLPYNLIRVLEDNVTEDIGCDLRPSPYIRAESDRRGGRDLYNVSLVTGHSALATARCYYCDRGREEASRAITSFWEKRPNEDKASKGGIQRSRLFQ